MLATDDHIQTMGSHQLEARGFEILRQLLKIGRHEDDPDTTYVHEWTLGDLIIWDNVALAHARPPFDSNESRTLRRTPIL